MKFTDLKKLPSQSICDATKLIIVGTNKNMIKYSEYPQIEQFLKNPTSEYFWDATLAIFSLFGISVYMTNDSDLSLLLSCGSKYENPRKIGKFTEYVDLLEYNLKWFVLINILKQI